jgi:ketosteroid isomerase-like protein
MMAQESPLDLAFRFVECINRGDVQGLAELMADDHIFIDLSGEEHRGREALIEDWRSYFSLCPQYMIHLAEAYILGHTVVLIGRTTGSHTGQPRREEFQGTLIWVAETQQDKLIRWQLLEDIPQNRSALGLDSAQRLA